jgi:hypothetical protein
MYGKKTIMTLVFKKNAENWAKMAEKLRKSPKMG